MNNILVFCAGESKARANYRKTILNPISEDCILSCLPNDKHSDLRRWAELAGGCFAWGIRSGLRSLTMWRGIEVDDCVLGFFDFHYRVVSRLVGKVQSGELAERLWSKPKEGWNWENIIFIAKPRVITVPASALTPYLCSTYRGATRIGAERIRNISRDFGSVEAFVRKSFGGI